MLPLGGQIKILSTESVLDNPTLTCKIKKSGWRILNKISNASNVCDSVDRIVIHCYQLIVIIIYLCMVSWRSNKIINS